MSRRDSGRNPVPLPAKMMVYSTCLFADWHLLSRWNLAARIGCTILLSKTREPTRMFRGTLHLAFTHQASSVASCTVSDRSSPSSGAGGACRPGSPRWSGRRDSPKTRRFSEASTWNSGILGLEESFNARDSFPEHARVARIPTRPGRRRCRPEKLTGEARQ